MRRSVATSGRDSRQASSMVLAFLSISDSDVTGWLHRFELHDNKCQWILSPRLASARSSSWCLTFNQ